MMDSIQNRLRYRWLAIFITRRRYQGEDFRLRVCFPTRWSRLRLGCPGASHVPLAKLKSGQRPHLW